MAENANIPYASKPARKKREQKGEPFVWLSGGAIMTGWRPWYPGMTM